MTDPDSDDDGVRVDEEERRRVWREANAAWWRDQEQQ